MRERALRGARSAITLPAIDPLPVLTRSRLLLIGGSRDRATGKGLQRGGPGGLMKLPSQMDRLVEHGEEVYDAIAAGQMADALTLMAGLLYQLSARADEERILGCMWRNGLASPRSQRLLREYEQQMRRRAA